VQDKLIREFERRVRDNVRREQILFEQEIASRLSISPVDQVCGKDAVTARFEDG